MFNSKNIKSQYNCVGEEIISIYNKQVSDFAREYKLSSEVAEEKLKKILIPLDLRLSENKGVNETGFHFEDWWADGTLKTFCDTSVRYELEGTTITAVEQLAVDVIHMVGVEIAALAGIPFGKTMPDQYQHNLYVWTNYGPNSNGSLTLDILCQVPTAHSKYGRQEALTLYAPAYTEEPAPDAFSRSTVFPQYEIDKWADSKYRKYIVLPHPFEPLSLTYYEAMNVDTSAGKRHIPARASISARDLQRAVRGLALYAFDKFYGLKAVPHGEEEYSE